MHGNNMYGWMTANDENDEIENNDTIDYNPPMGDNTRALRNKRGRRDVNDNIQAVSITCSDENDDDQKC